MSSDLTARGLDFPFLTGVINFDFPENSNDYFHRAGRTGRIGAPGTVISLFNKYEKSKVEEIKDIY